MKGIYGISRSFPRLFRTKGQVPTRYSPVRHSRPKTCVRLACVRPAASVRSEPGSNSQVRLRQTQTDNPGRTRNRPLGRRGKTVTNVLTPLTLRPSHPDRNPDRKTNKSVPYKETRCTRRHNDPSLHGTFKATAARASLLIKHNVKYPAAAAVGRVPLRGGAGCIALARYPVKPFIPGIPGIPAIPQDFVNPLFSF